MPSARWGSEIQKRCCYCDECSGKVTHAACRWSRCTVLLPLLPSSLGGSAERVWEADPADSRRRRGGHVIRKWGSRLKARHPFIELRQWKLDEDIPRGPNMVPLLALCEEKVRGQVGTRCTKALGSSPAPTGWGSYIHWAKWGERGEPCVSVPTTRAKREHCMHADNLWKHSLISIWLHYNSESKY